MIDELRKKFSTSVLLITHDLGVIAETCDNVAVMYAGHIVEYTDVNTLFRSPLHPYTKGLMKSIPRLDIDTKRLEAIKGLVPNLLDISPGCPFHPRCDFCIKRCTEDMPNLMEVKNNHLVRCHLVGDSK